MPDQDFVAVTTVESTVVALPVESIVSSVTQSPSIITAEIESVVAVEEQIFNVVSGGEQGPPGPPGAGTDTPWPLVRNSVSTDEVCEIPVGFQLIMCGVVTNSGSIVNDGDLVLI